MCVNHYCPMCGREWVEEEEIDIEVDSISICLDCNEEWNNMEVELFKGEMTEQGFITLVDQGQDPF